MGVIGHWRRSALGAGGVALLLPLGLTLGVALTTAFGGADTLRALGQVFAGPSAPRVREGGPADEPGLESAKDVPQVPVRRSAAAARTPSATPGSSGAPADATTEQPGTGEKTPSGGGTPTSEPEPGEPTLAPGGGGSGTPPPQEPPPGSLVHDAGQQAADVVKGVPVLGPAAGGAVQAVVDLIP